MAVRLLEIKDLNKALTETEKQINLENILENDLKNKCRILKNLIEKYARERNIELELIKV